MPSYRATAAESDHRTAACCPTGAVRLSPVHIPRPRVSALLSSSPNARLVLVGAPAGTGKTSAIAQWVHQLPGDVVWSRRGAVNSGSTWEALLGCLGNLGFSITGVGGRPGHERLLRLATEVADGHGPVTVVLDGYEVNETAVAVQLDFLLRHAAGRLRLVITSREDPIVPLEGRILATPLGLRQEDLAFTDDEADELFAALGIHDGQAARRANRLLGGWPLGLHLTARVLTADRPAPVSIDHAVRHASGINEYLLSEVLDAQAPDVRRFLLATSELDALTPDSVLEVGNSEALAILAGLPRLNVFLEESRDTVGCYRYPPFFRDLLRTQLSYESRISPPRVPTGSIPAQRTATDERPTRTVVTVPGPAGEELLIESLTPKELEVLSHLEELLTTEEIADAMFVSVNTVRTHVRNILRKLGVTRRYAAVRRARELGLVAAEH